MPAKQRMRDVLTGSPTLEYLNQMNASGWRLVALEWERDAESTEPADLLHTEGVEIEVPYGMQISEDRARLLESPAEMRVLMSAVNMIVEDYSMSGVAEELNREGYRTRGGSRWTAAAVFDLLPRMIETGPKIFTRQEWLEKRKRLTRD